MIEKQTDIIVVGSGPGGATVARELARSHAGLAITLLERGHDWRHNPLYGTYPGAMLYADRASFLFTQEGLNIIRPLLLGGATSMYCGCAERPLPWWQSRYGIDLSQEAEENGGRTGHRAIARHAARRGLHPHRRSGGRVGHGLAAAGQIYDPTAVAPRL
jgi:choline dehydrogenase-like flavoprotein